jgi:hypothetical protein
MRRIILVVLVLVFCACSEERNPCRDYTNSGVHPDEVYVITSITKSERVLCKHDAYIPKSLYAGISFYDKCDCKKWAVGDKLQIRLDKR